MRLLSHRPTLRTAIAVPFVLLFAGTVALQALTQQRQIEQLIHQESGRLLDSLTASSRNRLALFLDEPFRTQLVVADAIARHGLYKPGDMDAIQRYLRGVYGELFADQQQLSVLSFGSQAGDYAGLRRETGGDFTLMLKDGATEDSLRIYQGDRPGAVVAEFPGYDPRSRPWYRPVAMSGRPGWSSIYINKDERAEVAISAISPVLRNGEWLGVAAADVKLDGLNRFLRDEPLRGSGIVFITELDGRLVAHSEPGSVLAESGSGTRLLMRESANPLIRAVAAHIDAAPTESGAGFTIRHEGELYFCRVTPYSDTRGLDWRVVALVPEAALLGEIRTAQSRSMLMMAGIAVLAILLGLWGIGRITRPILETAAAANLLARGRWLSHEGGRSAIEQGSALRETALLVRAFNEMAERLQSSFARMREQLIYDDLTQLLTRRGLLEQVDWPQPRPAVLTLIALDSFRAINDSVGHATGDRLLQVMAHRLRAQLPGPLLLARIGGDEFAVLHLGVQPSDMEQQAAALGAQVLALFALPFTSGEDEVLMSASVGAVGGPLQGEALGDWLRNASIALGEAKRRGRGHCVVYELAMMEQSVQKARLATELRHALEKQELRVYYQPVVELASGAVHGVEALLRWQSPERGLVSPGVFIPVAEESDLILALGDWVLRRAMRDIAGLLPSLASDFELHVNVSVRQLIQSDFATTLEQALRDNGLPAGHLTLEITESLLIGQDSVTEERLRQIRALGVKIAIDDFGTGYSSLAYLQRLPFDCLKIDQSFIRNLSKSAQDMAIVTAVLRMAEGLGVTAVAEGVETEAEAMRLRELGCTLAQGYLFGRPTRLEDARLF
ncbi:EAL domain-containing protein [Paucibacter sp. PLA-PC-4]|uniref:bifunctional diguanylate cyclase/phosphodiesterase n=1 Tax=Paucibacter sp. PLA-PC-4 TaxID=2993655 RepID=UPI0022491940|nr:EAL domain-containing protein [Paucibacter sp. PLA-PC-4]MCX2860314.1 EAL domain-containing protein [Paucibacter sp. PLA-PC-4]